MDIEDRCNKAWLEYKATEDAQQRLDDFYTDEYTMESDFKAGYMAGVAQTQKDYSAHYLGSRNAT